MKRVNLRSVVACLIGGVVFGLAKPARSQSVQLPTPTNLRYTWDTEADGTPICGTESFEFDVPANPSMDSSTKWGIEVERNGLRAFTTGLEFVGPRALFDRTELFRPIPGIEQRYSVRAFSEDGTRGPAAEISVVAPRCDGLPPDGNGHMFFQFALVEFADSQDWYPFTIEWFRNEMLGRDEQTPSIGIQEFFDFQSLGRVQTHSTLHPRWIRLSKSARAYCDYYEVESNGRLKVSGCDSDALRNEVEQELQRNGVTLNANQLVVVTKSTVGSGSHGDGMTWVNSGVFGFDENGVALPETLFHEVGHGLDLQHTHDIDECEGKAIPDDLKVSAQDRECETFEYGTTNMGVGFGYAGYSSIQRILMGLLSLDKDTTQINPTTPAVVDLLEIDAPVELEGPRVLMFARDYEAQFLPSKMHLFVEFSSATNPLSAEGSSEIRFGLYSDTVDNGRSGLDDSFLGYSRDEGVVYLPGATLQEPGDEVALQGLGLYARFLGLDANNRATLELQPLSENCETREPEIALGVTYTQLAGETTIRYEARVNNEDSDCPSAYFTSEIFGTISGQDTGDQRVLVLQSGEEAVYTLTRTIDASMPDPRPLVGIRVKRGEGEFQTRLFQPSLLKRDVRLRTPTFVESGAPLMVTITSASNRVATYRISASSEFGEDFFAEPQLLRLGPSERQKVKVGDIPSGLDYQPLYFTVTVDDQDGELRRFSALVIVREPPNCTDGAQNGDELGIDCGGSQCPACEAPSLKPVPLFGTSSLLLLFLCMCGLGAAESRYAPVVGGRLSPSRE